MNHDPKDYHDYSSLDAPDHLYQVLDHFFDKKQNAYKFALAKKHFDHIKQQDSFVDATRLFKVLTGTDLVTKKHVMHYRTTQGMRYLVKKIYAQSNERDLRNARRQDLKNNQRPTDEIVTHTPSPFVQLMSSKTPLDDSSDEDSTGPLQNTDVHQNTPTKDTIDNEPSDKEADASPQTVVTQYQTDITKHADELEKTMESAMADLKDPEPPQETEQLSQHLESVLNQVIQEKLQPILQRLHDTENELVTVNKQNLELQAKNTKLQTHLDDLQTNYARINRQLNFNSRAVEFLEERFVPMEKYTKSLSDTIFSTVRDVVESKFANVDTKQKQVNDNESVQSMLSTQDKVQRRLHRLKEGTKKMFKDMESDYDLLTDRIHRLEENVQNLNKPATHTKPRRLDYKQAPESDDSSFSSIQKKPSNKYSNTHAQANNMYRNTYYRGPNIDYLRKNVNITCSEQNQILEFYIKFRLALEQGGIYILPIDQISKHKTIAQDKPGITTEDQRLQSNALFTLLSNEKIIPSDFIMAQNCIQGFASTMDGFGALRAMLKLTHPTLSKKRPSNVPPVLSESSDIHSYEQNLRNFYLLHKLFSNIEFPSIEKAKQFLHGMDDGQYTEAVQRVQHQLDTFESLKVPLTEDYTIDNIASTIINISSEYDNTKTIVNTMRQSYQHAQSNKPSFRNQRNTPPSFNHNRQNQKYRSDKFDKAQCFACKQFGHTVTHCRLLPKVLAIMQFKQKHGDKCDTILRQHIRNNTVESKRVFIRTLQNMNILAHADDSDTYLENDMIIHTLTDNGIDHDDFQSDEE